MSGQWWAGTQLKGLAFRASIAVGSAGGRGARLMSYICTAAEARAGCEHSSWVLVGTGRDFGAWRLNTCPATETSMAADAGPRLW